MRNLFWACCIIGLFGCASQPTTDALSSSIAINYPHDTAIIYAELLYITGSVAHPPQTLTLQLLDTEDNIVNEIAVTADESQWTVEFDHDYQGKPSEMTLRAIDPDTGSVQDEVVLVVSSLDTRPDGVFGTILAPTNGSQVGGDSILVQGRVSGVESILIEVKGDEGTIDSQEIAATNPYKIDDVLWQSELNLNGYIGQATLNLYDLPNITDPLHSIILTVLAAAG